MKATSPCARLLVLPLLAALCVFYRFLGFLLLIELVLASAL